MGSPTTPGDYIFENTATISATTQGGQALTTGAFPAAVARFLKDNGVAVEEYIVWIG